VGYVLDQTDRSIKAATDDKTLDPDVSAGPVAALRELARRIDAVSDPALDAEVRAALMSKDNVTLPTYLKACAELRLTPASRLGRQEERPEAPVGKLGKLQSIPRPA
jgi:hypothetical protein